MRLLVIAALITTGHAFWSKSASTLPALNEITPSSDKFTLRHVVGYSPEVKLHDVNPLAVQAAALKTNKDGIEDSAGPYTVKSSTTKIERLQKRTIPDIQDLLSEARYFGRAAVLPQSAWTLDEIPGPRVKDKATVLALALMAANAYAIDRNEADWFDATLPFNHSLSFGWKGDSLRGHVFANEDNSTIVMSIKGTSAAVFDGLETTTNDKVNDNLFFSCCCGQGGQFLWTQVCSCMTSSYTCNQTCLVTALKQPNRYYSQAIELYGNVTEVYPDSNVWLTGHSLGGATASLLGLTFGLPVVTFEAVPEALPAARLGLPVPPGTRIGTHQKRQYTGAYHFGHNADPVFMGTCNGVAFCTVGGYAMQSQCHTGNKCTYDTIGDKRWRQSLFSHGIKNCIRDVYSVYDDLPECEHDSECVDCAIWKFYKSNHTDTTTTKPQPTSISATRTRTETCKTPGWWGCRDGSTTTTPVRTSTTTVITETCVSYGWFGRCLDAEPTTRTITTTIPITPTTTDGTSICKTPGWWGCDDEDLDTTTRSTSMGIPTNTVCETPGLFWGCEDRTNTAVAHEITTAPHLGL
ncbi:MAG: hypothetical protein GOMPHAMPRED_000830 [Gomphillus americanus]|uniref:triacylglycerol lipase n=1 Tax=Gomphillus americanus TaxID=1940652 RepID=A0A8H3EY58_9LECA|nr:MAG: hypothetical protein GOMPHAMPRED_000830 [Gomphillus americanus]